MREYSPYGGTGGNATVLAIAPWDIIDILMAGVSWANLLAEPSWSNFAWAVLDTAALLPYLPNHVVIKNVAGKITGIKPDELAKFAKTVEGKKRIANCMRVFSYADGITSSAEKQILRKFKGSEGKKVLQLFRDAANKGFVAAEGKAGIKKSRRPS